MLAGGVLLMVLGGLVMFLGYGAAVGIGGAGLLGISLGASLFAMGFIMAVGGAIVNAIERSAKERQQQADRLAKAIEVGIDSLWKQLDVIRQNTALRESLPVFKTEALQAPAAYTAPESAPRIAGDMGYCPGCGKLRHSSVAKCLYCSDTAPVLTGKPKLSRPA